MSICVLVIRMFSDIKWGESIINIFKCIYYGSDVLRKMKTLVLLIFVAVNFINCDVHLGYQHKVPVSSYEVPIGSVGILNNDRHYYHVKDHDFSNGNVGVPIPSPILKTPVHQYTSFTDDQDILGNKILPTLTTTLNSYSPTKTPSPTAFVPEVPTISHSVNSLKSSNPTVENFFLNSKLNLPTQDSQRSEVQKHFYFFAAPEEPDEPTSRISLPPTPRKKNVNIVFIKAPSFEDSTRVQIPVQPQNEEKTIVYVLVKKPERQQIIIPTPVPTPPSKPEVYFIKYKTQKEAQDAVLHVKTGVATDKTEIPANPLNSDQVLTQGADQSIVLGPNDDRRIGSPNTDTKTFSMAAVENSHTVFASKAANSDIWLTGKTEESGRASESFENLPTSPILTTEDVGIQRIYNSPRDGY